MAETVERGTAGSGEPYPFRQQIQSGFGRHDIGGVWAQTGPRAAAAARAIGARAFAFGDRVAFDGKPDLHTAAHEAAHVVQQRAGIVPMDNLGVPGDPLERQADAVAERIVQGRSAEALLNSIAPPGAASGSAVQRRAVQLIPSKYGEFNTTKYDAIGSAGSERGIEIVLTFDPGAKVDAKKIGLTQSVRSVLAGKAVAIEPARHKRLVPSGTGEGREIDRTAMGAYANPLYAADAPAAADKLGDTATVAGWGQHGWHYTDASGNPQHQKAILKDTASLAGPNKNSEQVFETTALAVEGTQSGTYMGSVEWGWKVDTAGTFTKLPLKLISETIPTKDFMAAAEQWNQWKVRGTTKTTPDPTNVYDSSYAVSFTVAKDTTVDVISGRVHADKHYNDVTIRSGPKTGSTGRILTTDMRDTGGGRATIPLPIQRVSTIKTKSLVSIVNLQSARGSSATALATLTSGVKIKVINEHILFAESEVEIDSTQPGVTLSTGTKADIAGMVRGFVPRDNIN